jgi:hypothetical protein
VIINKATEEGRLLSRGRSWTKSLSTSSDSSAS